MECIEYTKESNYSQTHEIVTASLSQCFNGLNLSQFQTYCLFCKNLSTRTKII